jgi:hypothetical protein
VLLTPFWAKLKIGHASSASYTTDIAMEELR